MEQQIDVFFSPSPLSKSVFFFFKEVRICFKTVGQGRSQQNRELLMLILGDGCMRSQGFFWNLVERSIVLNKVLKIVYLGNNNIL